MAISDEIREQRKSLKGKGGKAYLQYYWDYYRYQTLAVIFFGGLLISVIISAVTSKEDLLSVTFLNTMAGFEADSASENIAREFMEYSGLSSADGQVTMSLNQTMLPGTQAEYSSMTTVMTLTTYMGAGTLDVMVANADNYEYYLGSGAFADLRLYFTEEELADFGDNLYYVDMAEVERLESEQDEAIANGELLTEEQVDAETAAEAERVENFVRPDPSSMEDPTPVGIFVEASSYIEGLGYYEDTVVIAGIIASSKHGENAAQFLQFLMTQTPQFHLGAE